MLYGQIAERMHRRARRSHLAAEVEISGGGVVVGQNVCYDDCDDVVDLRQVMGWPGLPLPGALVQREWVCGEVWTREFLPGCVLVTLRPAERSIGLESEALLDGLPELGAEGLRALLAEEVARDEGDDI